MKKVIFVCLLTLSVCLSEADVNNGDTKSGKETQPTAKTPVVILTTPSISHPTDAKTETNTQETVKSNETKSQESVKTTETKSQDTTTTTQNTKSTPAPDKNGTKATTNSNDAKPDNKATTTVKPAEHSTPNNTADAATAKNATTMKSASTTVQPHALQARGFDGASFVGGIILTLGLLAIGFMGFKYYKAQTERNYHTL